MKSDSNSPKPMTDYTHISEENFEDPFYKNKVYGTNLLNRPQPEGYDLEWLESLKTKPTEDFPSGKSLLIFRIANEWLALPSYSIKEITHSSYIHKLPHSNSPILLGISNIHGELLITVSMQAFLDLPPITPKDSDDQTPCKFSRYIVLAEGKDTIVFPVDEIHGITFIQPSSLDPPPLSTSKTGKNFFTGIFSLNETLIGLLDGSLIMDAINQSL